MIQWYIPVMTIRILFHGVSSGQRYLPYVLHAAVGAMVGSIAHEAAGQSSPPTITSIGPAGSRAITALSDDGSIWVGWNQVFDGHRAIRYVNGAPTELPRLTGGNNAYGTGVSGDGAVVVGYCNTPSGNRAFRWSAVTNVIQNLGVLGSPSSESFGRGISSNGEWVIGASGSTPFRSHPSSGMSSLNFPGAPNGNSLDVNADGSVVAGYGLLTSGAMRAFRWEHNTGGLSLGVLPGFTSSSAVAVSRDGSVIAGNMGGPYSQPFKWTQQEGATLLPFLDGHNFASARAMNDDGTILGGSSLTIGSGGEAVLWTTQSGVVALRNLLVSLGTNMTGWFLGEVTVISGDGTAIAGTGRLNGTNVTLVVQGLPCLADCNPVCDSIDFNNDGLTPDTADIADFLHVFSGGDCPTIICNDTDFNNDELFPDTHDISTLLSVFSGGPCF